MDCSKCTYDQVCCSPDAWKIPLTALEAAKITPRVRLNNGQYVLASGPNGMCYHFLDGRCTIYNDRPAVCKRFTCEGREKDIEEIRSRAEDIEQELESSHKGYFVAFISSTDQPRTMPDLVIKNEDSGKEVKIKPTVVFGSSEEEVKQKMIEILRQPFKKEDI